MVSLIEEHHWCMDDYKYILEQWVAIVMNVVDLSSNDDITQLIKWINKGHEIISFSTYQKAFSEQVSNITSFFVINFISSWSIS